MGNITIAIKMLLFIIVPVIISFTIWGIWMNPITYLERFISIIFGLITVIALAIIEISMIANRYYWLHR